MCCIRVDKWMEKPCKSWCQHMISAWFTFSIVLIRVVVQVVMKEGVWPVETEGKDQINCPGLGTFSQQFWYCFGTLLIIFWCIFSYNQSNDFVGDELSLHPLKLENVSESPSETPLSPVSETFWLSPTTEEKEFSSVNQIKAGKQQFLK